MEDDFKTIDDICAERDGQCEGCPAFEFCYNEWDE
jgi:hypothetical protein